MTEIREIEIEIADYVTDEAREAVAGSLAPSAIGKDSVEFYRAVLESVGKNPDELSFEEIVEVTRKLYALSADFRRDRAEIRKAEREAAKAEAKAKRDAERERRAKEEIAKIEARLAALRNG